MGPGAGLAGAGAVAGGAAAIAAGIAQRRTGGAGSVAGIDGGLVARRDTRPAAHEDMAVAAIALGAPAFRADIAFGGAAAVYGAYGHGLVGTGLSAAITVGTIIARAMVCIRRVRGVAAPGLGGPLRPVQPRRAGAARSQIDVIGEGDDADLDVTGGL